MSKLLELKLKSNVDQLKSSVPRPASGIPLNSMPGWADVPLYLKLPMLDCPNNQIVFTRSKIGHGLLRFKSDYDPYCYSEDNDYNPLHDPHLKNFYSRKRNLDLLKKIGKITNDNYVICNLHEFNSYRRMLNRFHLFSIYKEINRREQEHKDRAMLAHAEAIAERERRKSQIALVNSRDPIVIKSNKLERIRIQHERAKLIVEKVGERIDRINKLNELRAVILNQKKNLHNLAIEQRQIIAHDLLRNRIIALKKRKKSQNTRSIQHQRSEAERKINDKTNKAEARWRKILSSRTKQHQTSTRLIMKAEAEKARNIERRKRKSKKQWESIQEGIEHKSKARVKGNNKRMSTQEKVVRKLIRHIRSREMDSNEEIESAEAESRKNDEFSLRGLSRKDIRDAVQTAIEIQDHKITQNYGETSSIYQAAKYIIENILAKLIRLQKDLTQDEMSMNQVYSRIQQFFLYVKEGIIKKVQKILPNLDMDFKVLNCSVELNTSKENQSTMSNSNCRYPSLTKFVSFRNYVSPAVQDTDTNPVFAAGKMKSIRERPPTPAGSLTSVVGLIDTDPLSHGHSTNHVIYHCTRDESIFIEYFLVKFKRSLLIGVGRRVFQALRCYRTGKIFSFRQELLDLDQDYLIKIMSKSILNYATNKYNFKSNLRLCISALSADIICELQRSLIPPK